MQLNFETFYIAPVKTQDAWGLCDFIVSNENHLKRYFPKTLEQNLTPDLSKIFVQQKVNKYQLKEEFLFTLKEKQTQEIIGLIYIKDLDWVKKQGELAYCIGYQFEGKGLVSQSIKALSKYAFEVLKIDILQIITHKSNLGSVKVAENCNFIWRKTLKKEFKPLNESPIDMELFELYHEK